MSDIKNAQALLDAVEQIALVLEDVLEDGKVGLLEIPKLFPLLSEAEAAYKAFLGTKADFTTYDIAAAQAIAQRAFDVIIKVMATVKK